MRPALATTGAVGRMRIRRLVAVAATLVALGTAAITVVDGEWIKSLIADRVTAATGRQFDIAGSATIDWSLQPTIALDQVSLANPPWASRPALVTAQRIEVQIALPPLLKGEVVIRRLALVAPDVLLETDADGRGNWVLAAGDDAGTATAPPALDALVVSDARLAYRAGGATRAIAIGRLTAGAPDPAGPLAFALDGVVDDIAVTAEGSLATPATLLAGRGGAMAVKAKAAGAALTLDGAVGDGFDLRLAARGDDLGALAAALGVAPPARGAYAISARATPGKDGALRLDEIIASLGKSDLSGSLTIVPGDAQPRVIADLRSTRLDLGALLPSPTASAAAPGDDRVFDDAPLPYALLATLDAEGHYGAARVTFRQATLRDLDLDFTLADGVLTLALNGLRHGDGRLVGCLRIDGPEGAVALALDGERIALGRLLRELGESDLVETDIAMKADLRGRGGSIRALMASLDGRAGLRGGDGRIASGYVDYLAADLVPALAPWGKDAGDTRITCFTADFAVAGGQATATALALDTERMTVTGAGRIDLGRERLDLVLDPRPKDASLLSLATKLRVEGSLAAPTVRPDTLAVAKGAAGAALGVIATGGIGLIVPFLATGDEGDGCGAARAGLAGVEAPPPPPAERPGGTTPKATAPMRSSKAEQAGPPPSTAPSTATAPSAPPATTRHDGGLLDRMDTAIQGFFSGD